MKIARGIVTRCLKTGKVEAHIADVVVLATGGYGNVFSSPPTRWAAMSRRAGRHTDMVHCSQTPVTHNTSDLYTVSGKHQSKLTLMSESLRNDGRVWVPKRAEDCGKDPNTIPEEDRDYYLERVPAFHLVPRDIASRSAKRRATRARRWPRWAGGLPRLRRCDQTTWARQSRRALWKPVRYVRRITDDNPYETPMRIFPAVHYTMGGLWVDYNLMSSLDGLFVLGEANFSDHGANRLGASALMQGLADGYFVAPYTVGNYLGNNGHAVKASELTQSSESVQAALAKVNDRISKLLSIQGKRSPDSYHKELGKIMWDKCGMAGMRPDCATRSTQSRP